MKAIAILLFVALFGGCASVTTAHNFHGVDMENHGTPIETVVIENTGWTLLKLIPIGSGDPERPNTSSFRLFENTTTLQNNLDILEREMKSVGATRMVNLYSKTIDESVFIMLLTRRTCHTSAVLLQ